ncbi:hypothetical protein [Planctomyces sp. SH-PL62]|uniref:hypothetical protein n=1 Tax=Planctomyces sp. SH-PL62 TaxID=1636152 RepID=UPI00078D8EF2|nr:hypothetical protein [Planctomyces sp. SH-PL62]AMV40475.1 hypothetical protein VT85_23800 [Planctomyces sp. SH-PL62]
MPRNSSRTPSYRLHKPSGQAVVTIDGRDIYLGIHGTDASRAAYDRERGRWPAERVAATRLTLMVRLAAAGAPCRAIGGVLGLGRTTVNDMLRALPPETRRELEEIDLATLL